MDGRDVLLFQLTEQSINIRHIRHTKQDAFVYGSGDDLLVGNLSQAISYKECFFSHVEAAIAVGATTRAFDLSKIDVEKIPGGLLEGASISNAMYGVYVAGRSYQRLSGTFGESFIAGDVAI
ncbi:hypothetical protein [Ensifer sp.]|uniref:hypothetical protein n=1 Tax=Ensifer sp. TaxID=1872086 RepID=UPI002E1063B1|nr:hypothetical protein [Ensifer sp.]